MQYYENFREQTVLITGAAGMISRNIIRHIKQLDNKYSLKIRILAHVLNKEQAIMLQEEFQDTIVPIIGDVRTLTIVEPIDYIIHTAGVTGGSKQHIDFPMNTISVALDGTKQVLELAKTHKIKGMVYLSSLEVYGKPEKEFVTETDGGYIDSVNIRSSYSESKRMCECMCASYTAQFGVPVVIARLTATFGYGVSLQDNRVFSQFARSILQKEDIILKSSGETVRNYCDAADTAAALVLLLVSGKYGEAYNIANMATEISIKDMAKRFIELYPESGISLRFDCQENPEKLGYNAQMRNVLDSHKLMNLGWTPKYSLDDMIQHLVEYFRTEQAKQSTVKKYQRGFTVGTFDMFHVGHLNLFRQAKAYCNHLIVGVHSDEWVMHCKNRPTVISYQDRADIVASIRYVDEVVKNETRSKLEAWEKYHFDVAFIGDDWKGTEVWNKIEAELKEKGCDVIYIPYTKGISTTELRQKLSGTSAVKQEKKT